MKPNGIFLTQRNLNKQVRELTEALDLANARIKFLNTELNEAKRQARANIPVAQPVTERISWRSKVKSFIDKAYPSSPKLALVIGFLSTVLP